EGTHGTTMTRTCRVAAPPVREQAPIAPLRGAIRVRAIRGFIPHPRLFLSRTLRVSPSCAFQDAVSEHSESLPQDPLDGEQQHDGEEPPPTLPEHRVAFDHLPGTQRREPLDERVALLLA